MKTIIIALTTMLFSFTTLSDNPVDRLGIKGPLVYNYIKFNLVSSDKPNENYYIQKYLPKGESLDSFNQKLTIHLFVTSTKAKEAVAKKEEELDEGFENDSVYYKQVIESSDDKVCFIQFLTGETKNDNKTLFEFNVYQYIQTELPNKKKALILRAYTMRKSVDNPTKYLEKFGQEMTRYIENIIVLNTPEVNINDK